MAIDFGKKFGVRGNDVKASEEKMVEAQYWLNIGYVSDETDAETGETRFVSLPFGIPLDTQKRLGTKQANRDLAAFYAARNDLLDQLLEVGASLKPGEDAIYECENGLCIQIRRVRAAAEEAVADDYFRYASKLKF